MLPYQYEYLCPPYFIYFLFFIIFWVALAVQNLLSRTYLPVSITTIMEGWEVSFILQIINMWYLLRCFRDQNFVQSNLNQEKVLNLYL